MKGAYLEAKKLTKKWKSVARLNGKLKHLGYFETEQQAHEAYLKALTEANSADLNETPLTDESLVTTADSQ